MKKIMVFDDDTDLLANIKAFIRRQGYDVAVTTSCEEGQDIPRILSGVINIIHSYSSSG